jgi:single-strand DNA-binding protein
MNKLFIIGNLTADPETRTTKDGKMVVSFTVAVNRRREGVDWFRVSAWNKLGELCRMYLAKGRKVSVIGSVSAGSYTNSKGEAVGTLEVMAEDVEFLSPKESDAQESAYKAQERQAIQDEAKGYVQVSNEELPF